MRLHISEFEAYPEDPFVSDRLSRKQQVEGFCGMLLGIEGHAAVLLDGEWGSGKTAFTRMSRAYLRSQEIRVAEFNAWQQAHTDNALVDLVSAISTQVSGETKRKMIDAALKIGMRTLVALAKAATSGVVDLNDIDFGGDRGLMAPWEETEKETKRFKKHLEEAVSEAAGRIVVLIDELDRCHPSYALKLLSVVRHLFDVDGVIVVLAINRSELVHSIQSIYGPEFSADRFLRRFADLHAHLIPPNEPDLASFLNDLLSSTGMWQEADRHTRQMLWLVGEATGCGLRDIQQAAHHVAAVLASLDLERQSILFEQLKHVCVALIVLRTLDVDAFQNVAAGQTGGLEAIAAVRRSLTPMGANRPNVANKDLLRIEATLLAAANATAHTWEDRLDFGITESDFIEAYQTAVIDDSGEPTEVYRVFQDWKRPPPSLEERVKHLTQLIDMVAPR